MPRKLFYVLVVAFVFLTFILFSDRAAVATQDSSFVQVIQPAEPHVEGWGPSLVPDAPSTTTVFYATDDAPVRAGAPNATAPANPYLGAGYDNGSLYGSSGVIRSYLRFDLSAIPAGSQIVSASLRLHQAGGRDIPGVSRTVTLHRVTGNWNESSISWNNKPGYAEAVGSFARTYDYTDWNSLNVTSVVRNWVSGSQPNYGLVLVGPETIEGVYRIFFSREDMRGPQLEIHYLPAAPPVLDIWPGTFSVRASNSQAPPPTRLQISNVTRGSLNWTATKLGGAAWLSLSTSSGSVTPTSPEQVTLTVNASGLSPGTYTEQIRVSSSTANVEGSSLTATFTLTVVGNLTNVYLPFATGGSGSGAPEIVALVVGISDYQHLVPAPESGTLPEEWGFDLRFSHVDAMEMVEVVKNEMNVPSENITLLTDKEATLDSITGAFGAVNRKLQSETATNDTIFIFYYSGHGAQNPDLNGDEADGYDELIAAYDTSLNEGAGRFERVLTDDDLHALLAGVNAKHIILTIDSCFSGNLFSTTTLTSASGDLQRRGLVNPAIPERLPAAEAPMAELVGPNRLIITGGTADELTWESSALEGGVFTHFFLEALVDSVHDANQNGRISAEEAYWFSRDAADDWIFSNAGVHQNPDIYDALFGQADLTWIR